METEAVGCSYLEKVPDCVFETIPKESCVTVIRPWSSSLAVMARRAGAASAVLALLVLPACGDDSSDEGHDHTHPEACQAADTFAPNLRKTGSNGLNLTILQGTPAVPGVRMDHTWSVRIEDSSGAPIEGATVDVKQTMPSHDGHGVDRVAVSTDEGGGIYELAPVYFSMEGAWRVPITVTAGSVTDTVLFEFCVEG